MTFPPLFQVIPLIGDLSPNYKTVDKNLKMKKSKSSPTLHRQDYNMT